MINILELSAALEQLEESIINLDTESPNEWHKLTLEIEKIREDFNELVDFVQEMKCSILDNAISQFEKIGIYHGKNRF
jgi:predicted  nucleic acid-binding Zn-ribbon protein